MGRRKLSCRTAFCLAALVAAASLLAGCEDLLDIIAAEVYKTYTLTITNDGHGTTVPAGAVTAESGKLIDIAATANPVYSFDQWEVISGLADITTPSSGTTQVRLTSGDATIIARFLTAITVASPDGGGAYLPNSNLGITWSTTVPGNPVRIDLYKSGVLHTIVTANTTNDESFDWTVPLAQTIGGDYRIRITNTMDSSMWDESNTDFAIEKIMVTAPSGAAAAEKGKACSITWTSSFSGNVSIDLWKGGSAHSSIIASTPNDGSYSWQVPSTPDIPGDTDYTIRITTAGSPSVSGNSAAFGIAGWTDLGYASPGAAQNCDIAVGPDGKPVVLYREMDPSTRTRAYKHDSGTTWTDLGYVGPISTAYPSIAVGTDNLPVVALQGPGEIALGLRWNSGTTWDILATTIGGKAPETRIAIGSDNLPFVAYRDLSSSPLTKMRIKRFNSVWEDLGDVSANNGGFAPDITVDTDSKAIVVFRDAWVRASVLKWSSLTTWTDMGQAGSNAYDPRIAISDDGKPAVIYRESNSSPAYRPRVRKFNSGTTWDDLGYVSAGIAGYADIAVPADDKPWVIFTDNSIADPKSRVLQWSSGTTWIDRGYISAAGSNPAYNAIVIDPASGYPVVVFQDCASSPSFRAHVLRWEQ